MREDGKRSNWELIPGILSKFYPIEETGVSDWNYLRKVNTPL